MEDLEEFASSPGDDNNVPEMWKRLEKINLAKLRSEFEEKIIQKDPNGQKFIRWQMEKGELLIKSYIKGIMEQFKLAFSTSFEDFALYNYAMDSLNIRTDKDSLKPAKMKDERKERIQKEEEEKYNKQVKNEIDDLLDDLQF